MKIKFNFQTFLFTNLFFFSQPRFQDEFKILLPPDVSDRHHLLFSFYHVAADVRKLKKGGETAVLVGQVSPTFL